MLDNQKHITKIILKHFPKVHAIYIFGSEAQNKQNKDSDIDIALLFDQKTSKEIGNLTLNNLHSELVLRLKKDVDLVNLRSISTVFQKEIIGKGKAIFCQNNLAKDEFEMMTLSFYQKLNFERKEILEKIYG